MNDPLTTALQIGLVGIILTFGAILLLWLVMALLVRLTQTPQAPQVQPSDHAEHERRRRAAALAVAVALARRASRHQAPRMTRVALSPWQHVMRSRQTQRGARR
jgi:hypothetical protein